MSLGRAFKDPNATLDYTVNWALWLTGAETIAAAEWIITPDPSPDLVVVAESNDETSHTIWLSGGTAAARYTITSRITTDASPNARVDERFFTLKIQDQ